MAYGDYSGPDKSDKGKENGSCNRQACQAPNAIYFNQSTERYYCRDCARDINRANRAESIRLYGNDKLCILKETSDDA